MIEENKYPLTEEENKLIREIKRLDNEINITTTRNRYTIGRKINDFYQKSYGDDTFSMISEHTGINKNSLYKDCQVAREFSDKDIDLLCDGPFVTPYKLLKGYLKYGREKIMAKHSESSTLKEFKENLKKLRSENCPQGTKLEEKDAGDSSKITSNEANNESFSDTQINKDLKNGFDNDDSSIKKTEDPNKQEQNEHNDNDPFQSTSENGNNIMNCGTDDNSTVLQEEQSMGEAPQEPEKDLDKHDGDKIGNQKHISSDNENLFQVTPEIINSDKNPSDNLSEQQNIGVDSTTVGNSIAQSEDLRSDQSNSNSVELSAAQKTTMPMIRTNAENSNLLPGIISKTKDISITEKPGNPIPNSSVSSLINFAQIIQHTSIQIDSNDCQQAKESSTDRFFRMQKTINELKMENEQLKMRIEELEKENDLLRTQLEAQEDLNLKYELDEEVFNEDNDGSSFIDQFLADETEE